MKISQKLFDLCTLLEEKKAEDIVICDTQKLSNAVSYYVIATASSSAHANGILNYIEEQIQQKQLYDVVSKEGYITSNWLVLDLDDLFVHILTKDLREHYNLEKLVNEGNNVKSFEKIKKDLEKQNKKIKLESNKKLKNDKKHERNKNLKNDKSLKNNKKAENNKKTDKKNKTKKEQKNKS